jgi:hypothetical protein
MVRRSMNSKNGQDYKKDPKSTNILYSNSTVMKEYMFGISLIRLPDRMSFDRFVDDRLLTSRDALNKSQLKIKLVNIDENARDYSQRFGQRVLVKKVLVTIRYTDTEQIEEVELDLEELELKIKRERLFSSSNRWVSPNEIKNSYIISSRHLDLLSDAIALDIISF